MHILIAGGAGFIGYNLTARLIKEGHQITVVDSLITSSVDSVARFKSVENFKFVEESILELSEYWNLDFIFNLACAASPPKYQADPINTLLTCTSGTNSLLKLALKNNCPIIHASTSEIYGNPLETPQAESYFGNVNSWGPRACYDEGKRAAEALCYDYKNIYSLDVRPVRIFNTYGPFMQLDDGRIVTNMIKSFLESRPVTIYGDGLQSRSFCYVDDLIDGLVLLMKHGPIDGPINLGNDVEITIRELIQIFQGIVRTPVSIEHIESVVDDPLQRRPSLVKVKSLLDWSPKTAVSDGLQKTLDHFLR